jgi:uncharacterized protein YdeI (YjbR/CyaY-like superfamily)
VWRQDCRCFNPTPRRFSNLRNCRQECLRYAGAISVAQLNARAMERGFCKEIILMSKQIKKPAKIELAIMSFDSPKDFQKWLAKNQQQPKGIWLRIFKKDSGTISITYAEALDEALCYGWIDGQKLSGDESSWLQKFTPRRPGSGWSKKNTEHAERLITGGRMQPRGHEEINAAKHDARWQAAYDSPRNAAVPAEFLKRLNKNKPAKTFFATLNRRNLYAITYRLQTAKKPETLEKRITNIIAMLAQGETFHP